MLLIHAISLKNSFYQIKSIFVLSDFFFFSFNFRVLRLEVGICHNQSI